MKTRKTELDVDFIGGQGSLTTAEEKALSAYFKQRKTSSVSIKVKQKSGSLKPVKAHA